MNISDQEGWYKITRKIFQQHGGSQLLSRYGHSLRRLLASVYSEYHWDHSKFTAELAGSTLSSTSNSTVDFKPHPSRHWEVISNQRAFLDDLATKLNITDQDGWYSTTVKLLQRHGGGSLLNRYNCSLIKLLSSVYPEYHWNVAKFTHVPQRFWDNADNQRAFMDELAKTLNITHHEGWYHVTSTIMHNHRRGSSLINKYNGSINKLLQAVYPEHSWDLSKFDTMSKGYWEDTKMQRSFMDTLAKKLNITDHKGWYKVSRRILHQHGAGGLLAAQYNNSVSRLLMTVYPEYPSVESLHMSDPVDILGM